MAGLRLRDVDAVFAHTDDRFASLQLSEAALVGLGIMAGPVIASIHEKRDEYRKDLQTAAGRHTHAFRRSSSPARRSGPTSAA